MRPCSRTLEAMVAEVTSELHPEHMPSNGPEQDYLTRYFASAPWHALDVRWNYQIHHIPFALEQVINFRRFTLERGEELSEEDRAWRPPRLRARPDEIGLVHFSGDTKLWHLCLDAAQETGQRRAVEHFPSKWTEIDSFAEHLLRTCCKSYTRWVDRSEDPCDYEDFGCELTAAGGIRLLPGSGDDLTPVVDEAVAQLRSVARLATRVWRDCAQRLLAESPSRTLLEDLQRPSVPDGSFRPGARVEVLWRHGLPEELLGRDALRVEEAKAREQLWLPAKVVSVHADGHHVVRYDRGGTWGDTERRVPSSRLRPAEVTGGAEVGLPSQDLAGA